MASRPTFVMARMTQDAKGRPAITPVNRKICAINDCGERAAGLMDWPDANVQIYLCQEHANRVRAIEHAIDTIR